MADPFARIATLGSGWLRNIENAMFETTALSGRAPNPFDYGAVKAVQFAPLKKTTNVPDFKENSFGVLEARERIREFIDGTFSPKRFPELVNYFSRRKLSIESRVNSEGKVNYLVDTKTRAAVPASLVDRRLTHAGLTKAFGKKYELSARSKTVEPPTAEQKMAQKLRRDNARYLRLADAKPAHFDGWGDLSFSAPALFGGRELSVQGRDVWVGIVHATASSDPAENLRVMAEAKAKGMKLVLPASTRDDANAGKFVAGMPILLRDSAVRTRFIDQSLSFQSLSTAFGETLQEHFEGLHSRGRGRVPGHDRAADVLDMASFRAQFAKKASPTVNVDLVEAPAPAAVRKPLAGEAPRYFIRHQIGGNGVEQLSVIDVRTGEPAGVDMSSLGAGVYAKEDGFGMPIGTLKVDQQQRLHHFDEEGRLHNSYGAAIVPPAGSGEPKTYAVDGVEVRPVHFEEERTRAFRQKFATQPPAAEVAVDEPALQGQRTYQR